MENNNTALEGVKKMIADRIVTQEAAEKYFPELKENEDEKWIPKEIAEYLKEKGGFRSCWLAWLEKQGAQNPYSGVSFEYNGHTWGMCARDNGVEILVDGEIKERVYLFNRPQGKSALETLKEEKADNQNCANPVVKIEPKFKVGDWIITNKNHIWYVDETPETTSYLYRLINQYSKVEIAEFEIVDKKAKLWTINDAKDGDVLVDSYSKDSIIILYKGINKEQSILAHCGWNGYNFSIKTNGLGYGGLDNTNYLPATKEQRYFLFAKMREAGYEWDAKKKELKKIEQKSADTWKPSEEQIKVLEFFIPYVTKCSVVLQKSKDTLLSLLSDLKKLREE